MDKTTIASRSVRLACLVGAVLDGLWVIPMVMPEIGLTMYGLPITALTPPLRYALGIGAALMAGWTVLLIWTAMKPLERRNVLLMTLVPVKLGLDLASLMLVTEGLVDPRRFLLMKTDSVVVYLLFIAALVLSSPKRMK